MSKRSASPPGGGGALVKRARGSPAPETQLAISSSNDARQKALVRTVQRTSGLDAPIVSLAGAHSAEITSCRFDPSGQNIAACSTDRSVSLWRTYPPNTNYGLLAHLHKAPILDVQWALGSPLLYTASADHTVGLTDASTGARVRRLRAHRGVVNALDRALAGGAAVELLASAADDGAVKVWEGGAEGAREPVASLAVGCPVTAVAFGADGNQVFAGALDNEIHVFDLRTQKEIYALGGHADTPLSLALSPDGAFLLAPSLASTTLVHDVRPFAPAAGARVHRALGGAPAGFESTLLRGAWSRDDGGRRAALGGADRTVTVWDVDSGKVLYKLPGHKGTVTAVDFHPTEPIILTGSKDATLLLGELEPTARV